jgi:transposase
MNNINLSDMRIFLCLNPIKMQFSFDTLMGLAQEIFDQDPLSGHLFLFFNRKRDRIKILFWDATVFALVQATRGWDFSIAGSN